MYKNIDKQTKLTLKELVEYQEGQVVSKTLVPWCRASRRR